MPNLLNDLRCLRARASLEDLTDNLCSRLGVTPHPFNKKLVASSADVMIMYTRAEAQLSLIKAAAVGGEHVFSPAAEHIMLMYELDSLWRGHWEVSYFGIAPIPPFAPISPNYSSNSVLFLEAFIERISGLAAKSGEEIMWAALMPREHLPVVADYFLSRFTGSSLQTP